MILRRKLPCRSGNRKLVSSTLELTKRNSSNYFRNYTKLITFCRLTRYIAPNQIPSPETPPQYFPRQIGSGEFAGTVWRLMDSGHRTTLIGHSTHLGHSPARLRSARLGSAPLKSARLGSARLGASRSVSSRSVSGPPRVRLGSVSGPSRSVSICLDSVSGPPWVRLDLSRFRLRSALGPSRVRLGSVSGPSRVRLGSVSGPSRSVSIRLGASRSRLEASPSANQSVSRLL